MKPIFYRHNENRVKIKICGIVDVQTARLAINAGADALGFVFAPESRRYIDPETARRVIASIPDFVDSVGVFVDSSRTEINRIAQYCNLNIIQLHDFKFSSPPKYSLPTIRCVRVKDSINQDSINIPNADAILIDTYHPDLAGGTGETFDWRKLANIKINEPLILAGGLNSHNVAEAINIIKPCAVDVSSGVETNGKKDIGKIKEFIKAAREVTL